MVEIELGEGETIVDAISRIAKANAAAQGRVATEPVEAIGRKAKGPKKRATKTVKDPGLKSNPNKPAASQGGDPSAGQELDGNVYMACHLYKRGEESDGKVHASARMEREMRGPNVLVFAHMHKFGDECGRNCKVRVTESDD